MKKSPDSSASRALITASSRYKITTGSYTAEYIELTREGKLATDPDGDPVPKLHASLNVPLKATSIFCAL
jgi:hypothetical protein